MKGMFKIMRLKIKKLTAIILASMLSASVFTSGGAVGGVLTFKSCCHNLGKWCNRKGASDLDRSRFARLQLAALTFLVDYINVAFTEEFIHDPYPMAGDSLQKFYEKLLSQFPTLKYELKACFINADKCHDGAADILTSLGNMIKAYGKLADDYDRVAMVRSRLPSSI